jgi:hypothetical protein
VVAGLTPAGKLLGGTPPGRQDRARLHRPRSLHLSGRPSSKDPALHPPRQQPGTPPQVALPGCPPRIPTCYRFSRYRTLDIKLELRQRLPIRLELSHDLTNHSREP